MRPTEHGVEDSIYYIEKEGIEGCVRPVNKGTTVEEESLMGREWTTVLRAIFLFKWLTGLFG